MSNIFHIWITVRKFIDMTRFPVSLLSFLIGLFLSALSVQGQTIESVMRALQERHIAVEQREYAERKASYYNAYDDEFSSNYEAYEVEPIEWVSGVFAYPQDGALDSLSLDDWLEQMDELRDEYNGLRREYVFPANSTESSSDDLARVDRRASILRQIEPIDEENFTSLIAEMGSGLNQMKYLIWPSMLQYASRDNQRYEDKPNPIDISVSAFDGDSDWSAGWDWYYWGYGYSGGWYYWDYYYGQGEFDILDSYYFSNSHYSRRSATNYYYHKYDKFSTSGSSLVKEDAEVPHRVTLDLYASNVGFLFFTGSELGGEQSVDGRFSLLGRQWPTAGPVSDIVTLESGAWPNGYEEFKGYKKITEFSSGSEKVEYNVLRDFSNDPSQSSFATGGSRGSIRGKWEKTSEGTSRAFYTEREDREYPLSDIRHRYMYHEADTSENWTFFLKGYSPSFTEWDISYIQPGNDSETYKYHYGKTEISRSRYDEGPFPDSSLYDDENEFSREAKYYLPNTYHQTSGILLFEPNFEHAIDFKEAVFSSTPSESLGEPMADLRRQIAYIDIGRGVDGVGQGFIGFGPATNKSRHFDGLGQVIDLALMTELGDFEVYYESNVDEFPGSLDSAMDDEYVFARQSITNGSVDWSENISLYGWDWGWDYGYGVGALFYPKMEWYLHPRIKQVVGKDVVVNVIPSGSGSGISETSYRLEFFRASQKGGFSGGQYAVSGAPFNIIEVVDEGPSASSPKFTLSGNSKKITVEYDAVDENGYWDYYDEEGDQNNGRRYYWFSLEKQEEYTQYNFKKFTKIITENVSGPSVEVEESYDEDSLTYSRKVDGDVVSELVYPSENNFYQTRTSPLEPLFSSSMDVNPSEGGGRTVEYTSSLSPFSYVSSTTGPHAFSQTFDDYGRVTEHSTQMQGADYQTTVTTDGNVVETVVTRDGATVEKSWVVYEQGMRKVTEAIATSTSASSYSDSSNLTTVTTFYGGSEGDLPWAVKSIEYSDGRTSNFSYQYNSGQGELTTTVTTGPVEETTVVNGQGYLVSATTEEDGVTVASATANTHDAWGRPTKITYLDGTSEEFTYYDDARGLLSAATDRNGIESTYTYDILGRLRSVDSDVDVDYKYEGFTTTASYTGGYTISSTTNAFGELQAAYNSFEPSTRTAVNGFTYTTTNQQTRGTTVEQRYPDGTVSAISGTSVEPTTIEYGVTGSPVSAHSGNLTFVKRSIDASGGNIYETTYYDAAGRTAVVEGPSASGSGVARTVYHYNNKGQLEKVVDPDDYETEFGYNSNTGRRETITRGGQTSTSVVSFGGGNQTVTTSIDGQEIRKVVTDLSDYSSTITPWGNSALNTSVTPNIGSREITINGPGGSIVQSFSNDWALTGTLTKDLGGTTIASGTMVRDDYDRLESLSGSAGGASLAAEFSPDGRFTSATENGHTTNFNYTNNFKTLTAGTQAGDVVINTNLKGELTGLSRPGVPSLNLNTDVNNGGVTFEIETSANGAKTTVEANEAGVSEGKDFASGAGVSFRSSRAGRPDYFRNGRGINADYGYDNSGFLDSISYSDGTPDVNFGRNDLGLVDSISDASGSLSLTYNKTSLDQEIWNSGELGGFTVDRSYDGRDRMDGLVVKRGAEVIYSVDYGYDGNNPELDTISFDNNVIDYELVQSSKLLDTATFSSGGVTQLTVDRDWDSHNRLDKLTSSTGALATFISDPVFGSDGRIERINSEGGDYWEVDYQGDGQLDTAVFKSNASGLARGGYDFDYTFSSMGHRTSLVLNSSSAQTFGNSPNILNQISSRTIPGAVEVVGRADSSAVIKVFSTNALNPIAFAGSWQASTAVGGYTGSNYLTDGNSGKGKKWVDYKVTLAPGTYRLDMRWPEDSTHASSVPVIVTQGENRSLHTINQKINGGIWNALQNISVVRTTDIRLRIGTIDTDGLVVADAIRYVYTGSGSSIPTQTLDSDVAVAYDVATASVIDGYFHTVLSVDNGTAPLALDILVEGTVDPTDPTLPDAVSEEWSRAYVPPASVSMSYNADGMWDGDWRWSAEWDGPGNLTVLNTNQSAIDVGLPDLRLEFDYDAEGRRFKKTVYRDGLRDYTRYFLYDGWNLIAELDGNRNLLKSFVWGPDISGGRGAGGIGGLVGIIDHISGKTFYPTFNYRGDVTALIDAADGSTAATYNYGPFGETIGENGLAADSNPFRFSTKYTDEETGLIYFGYRYLNPETGSWLSREPLGEGASPNLYTYANNDPVNNIDVLGLYTVEGMISEFGALYGDNPDAMLALILVMSRYEVVQGEQLVSDWSVNHTKGQIAINATNFTPWTGRSNRNAAKQMYQVLADEFYEVSNLPETLGGAFRRRGGGTLQMAGGAVSVVGGGVLIATPEPTMLTKIGGYGAIVVGGNEFIDGGTRAFGGRGASFNVLDMTARSYGNWVAGDVGAEQASFYMGISRFAFGSVGGLGGTKLGRMPMRQIPAAARAQLDIMAIKVQALTRGQSFYDDLASLATKNPGSNKVVLGRSSEGGVMYRKVASHFQATSFKIDNWSQLSQALTGKQIWNINRAFLRKQISLGKEIIISHDPFNPSGFYFTQEISYLKNLGYSFEKSGWVWRAVKK
ncbi:MAG: hypothetical protein CML13_06645 [Puniceicoccaceae bacterium]|nr:hypothetical protein [Puniceicoccaceae bacterium]|tara:strand:- start:3008 stop:10789 length:7782 start_codon:yes stop_codon:yes gene_type:complete